jgi:hypothetical protein
MGGREGVCASGGIGLMFLDILSPSFLCIFICICTYGVGGYLLLFSISVHGGNVPACIALRTHRLRWFFRQKFKHM